MESAHPYLSQENRPAGKTHIDGMLATRFQRFGASVIDMVLTVGLTLPLMSALGWLDSPTESLQSALTRIALGGLLGLVIFAAMHGYFLSRDGQTIGKKLFGIQITDLNDNLLSLTEILLTRYLPMMLVTWLPFVGGAISMIETAFIFRADRRCLHDLIAGTKVVRV
jgi:uncharacterized RDD family membrane protein YckC